MTTGISSLVLVALALLLIAAGVEDARRREIANWKNIAIALLAPVWWWTQGLSLWPGVPIQIGVAAAVFALFVGAFHFGWMGGGDVKMIGALALWLPFQPLIWMLTVMSIVGGVLTLLMMIERAMRRRETAIEVPYGIAIAVAALLTLREPILNQFP